MHDFKPLVLKLTDENQKIKRKSQSELQFQHQVNVGLFRTRSTRNLVTQVCSGKREPSVVLVFKFAFLRSLD